eukprot:TRINITY_DN115_c0_g3_i4.p1 TRINITY_DN115_c0_g3~~TRINITY_DN115_c0_g3_i4.p1  ORF type:complete len:339 (+),score=94.75 TRINITY_DN115_c0_g3_i4:117-1133(+)
MPLGISQQEALGKEAFFKNGSQVILHIVSKNHEFNFRVQSSTSFNSVPLVASLHYDGNDRSVECAKGEAMDYSIHLDATGLQAVVETKINVLSSQLDNSYFRVVFQQGDEKIHSHPVQCVSKKGQVQRVLSKLPKVSGGKLSASKPVASAPALKRKRTPSAAAAATTYDLDDCNVDDRLRGLQEQLQVQHGLLMELVSTRQSAQLLTPPSAASASAPVDVESAMHTFLEAFDRCDPHEQESKIRRVLSCPLNSLRLRSLFELTGLGVGPLPASDVRDGRSTAFANEDDPSATSASSPASAFGQSSPELDPEFLLPVSLDPAAACYSPSASDSADSFVA